MNIHADGDKPTIIDIEASGLAQDSYPIEIGIALPDGSAHCYLIQPYSGWTYWDEEAEKLHRLTRKTIERFGMDGGYVARQLNLFLKGQTVYSDNLRREQSWLDLLFGCADLQPEFRMEDLAAISTVGQRAAWDSAREQVVNELGLKRHRASADARVKQLTWLRTQSGGRRQQAAQ